MSETEKTPMRAAFEAWFINPYEQRDESYWEDWQAGWNAGQAALKAAQLAAAPVKLDRERMDAALAGDSIPLAGTREEKREVILQQAAQGERQPVAIRGCFDGVWYYGPWVEGAAMTSEWEPLYTAQPAQGERQPDDAYTLCLHVLRQSGKPYPRTCTVCGFGACKNGL